MIRRRRSGRDPRALDAVGTALSALPDEVWERPTPPPLDVERARAARPAAGARAGGRGGRREAVLARPLAATFVAVVLLGVGVLGGLALAPGDGGDGGIPRMRVALAALPDGGAPRSRAVVQMPVRAGGIASLSARGLPRTRSGDYYEVWLMTDGTHLVSLGEFRVGRNGRARVRLPVAVDPRRYRYVDVSLEPDDGNPGHSGRSVLRSAAIS